MNKSKTILIWGGITGVALALYYQILNATGQEDSGFKWFSLLITFLGLFIGTIKYRDKVNGGYLTFGEGFKISFLMVLIIAVIGIIATMIDMQIHPDFVDKILERSRTNMINKGYSEEQIEMGMHYTKMFTTPVWIVIWISIFNLFFGAILGLIVAGISNKKKPFFEEDNNPGNTPQV